MGPRAKEKPAKSAPEPPKAVPVSSAGLAYAAERRIEQLRGQIRQDCASMANAAQSVARRIADGDAPRQEGEFGTMARILDQNCASLYELLRLYKCYK